MRCFYVLLIFIFGLSLSANNLLAKETNAKSEDSTSLRLPSYTVSTVVMQPDRIQGKFELVGVVSFVYPKKNLFVVIDTTEFEECGRTDCAAEQIPVEWTQPMPKIKDFVRLQGEIKKTKDGFLFIAKNIQVQSSPKPMSKKDGK